MQIVVDEVDRSIYSDIVLSPAEINFIQRGEMISGEVSFNKVKCYIGIRLQGTWEYSHEDEEREED